MTAARLIFHGTQSGYRHHGCRCDQCRRAAADARGRLRGNQRRDRFTGAGVPVYPVEAVTGPLTGRCRVCGHDDVPLVADPTGGVVRWACPTCKRGGVFVSGRDIGDQVAGLLVAIADRHDSGDCTCPNSVEPVDSVCVAGLALADEIEATP